MITTATFRVRPQTCVRELMLIYLRRNLWWLLTPVAASVAIGVAVDMRFLFIAAMMIFIIIPMIMVPVYLSHALRPELRELVTDHYVTFHSDRLETVFVNHEEDIIKTLPAPRAVEYDNLTSLKKKNGNLIIGYTPGHYNIIIIPSEAFHDAETADRAIELIYAYGDRSLQNI